MFALLATVFLVAEIFSDSFYSIYFRFNNNHDVCIPFVMANFILWYTCLLCAIIWVGGVDVCNVDSPLFVCACFMDPTCWMPE